MILLLWVRWSAVLNLATCMAVYTNTAYTPNTVYKNTAYTPNVRILPAVEGFGQKMHACATQLAYAALRAGFEL